MLNALESILSLFANIGQLIINIFTSLLNFLLNIPNYVNVLSTAIAFLPAVLVPFALASVSVYVVLFVIDRR